MKARVQEDSITLERRFPGPPSELWPYLTESEHLSAWITPGATVEARLGGHIHFPWSSGEPAMHGVITAFDPPFVLEYQWVEGEVHSTVRLELVSDGAETMLRLHHRGLPTRDASGFAAGWHAHLDWLDAVRAGTGAEFDQKARFMELAKEYGWERSGAEA